MVNYEILPLLSSVLGLCLLFIVINLVPLSLPTTLVFQSFLDSLDLLRAHHMLRVQCIRRDQHLIVQLERLHHHLGVVTPIVLVAIGPDRGAPAEPDLVVLVYLHIQNRS